MNEMIDEEREWGKRSVRQRGAFIGIPVEGHEQPRGSHQEDQVWGRETLGGGRWGCMREADDRAG